MIRRVVVSFSAVVLLAFISCNALAQQPVFRPRGDHWLPWDDNNPYTPKMAQCGVDKALYDHWRGSMIEIANILAETPGATAADWWSHFQATFISCKDMLRGGLIYWSFDREDLAFTPGKALPRISGETWPLTLLTNRLDGLEMLHEMNEEGGPQKYGYLPKVTQRFSGFPVYNERVFLITPPGRQPFLPIPLGEALSVWLKNTYWNDWRMPNAQQLLDSLDEAGRSRPAYLRIDENHRKSIVTEPAPDTFPIMRYNPSYFDKTLPLWMPQSITIDTHFMDLVPPLSDPKMARRVDRRMLEAADWKRVAELLH